MLAYLPSAWNTRMTSHQSFGLYVSKCNVSVIIKLFRRGCSQSELQVTNVFSCSEECGEVFGDKI